MALALLVACAPPDRPTGVLPSPPAAAMELLAPDSIRGVWVGDGAVYYALWSPAGPWAVHLVSAEVDRCDFRAMVTPAPDGDDGSRVRTKVSELVPHVSGTAYAGVNGDFFTDEGLPVGPEIAEGSTRVRARPAFAWGVSGAWIGEVRGEGDAAEFGHYHASEPGGDVFQAIGGFPVLLQDGEVVGDLEVGARSAFAAARHPRTAIGLDEDGGRLWLAVVDGRGAHSVGMSLPELTALLHSLGVEDAVNLDGGGSTTMWIRGQVVNRPSDPTGERPVANGLWLVDLPGRCG